MNLIEVLKSAFEPFLDGDKPPLHIGEAYHLWYYKIGIENTLKNAQIGFNVCQDPELKEKINDLIENVLEPIKTELEDFLKNEGVPLPNISPEKPLIMDVSNLSEGIKLTDEETANQLSWAVLMGIQIATRGLTESVRADVGAHFGKYQMLLMIWGLNMKQLLTKKGWLHTPPSFKG
ncbi:DUF3231 family protein [Paenibacillus ferrarius]|uniref:DUF3231 family protein n=1 Tax=Paenibacillus ferrarius TaxID=1469647 RepID=UPI003D2CD02E